MKKYREWISENERVDRWDLLTPEQVEWCEKWIYQEWWVDEKREVHVEDDLSFNEDDLDHEEIEVFPVQFADVKGRFNIGSCKKLISLKGAPRKVGEDFDCNGCVKLTSLEGAPEYVGGNFNCNDCVNLTSLEGAPEYVGGNFYCYTCKSLTSLEGLPKKFNSLFAAECPKLPQVEKDFLDNEELQEKWKKSPLDWKKFMYTSGAAKGRKFGL